MPDPDSGQLPVLDEAVLAELTSSVQDDRPFVVELVNAYLADGPAQVDAIEAAVAANDAAALVRPAHTLKSSSATVGAQRLAAASRELEMVGRSGSVDSASAASLRADWEAAVAALQAWVAGGCRPTDAVEQTLLVRSVAGPGSGFGGDLGDHRGADHSPPGQAVQPLDHHIGQLLAGAEQSRRRSRRIRRGRTPCRQQLAHRYDLFRSASTASDTYTSRTSSTSSSYIGCRLRSTAMACAGRLPPASSRS